MKTLIYSLVLTLLAGLFLPSTVLAAPAVAPDSLAAPGKPFEINLFLGSREKINLILAVRQPRRVTVQLKDASQGVVYVETFRRETANHWLKFDFEGMKPGVYSFEISDGTQKVIRQIEIGHIPAIEPQRYITSLP